VPPTPGSLFMPAPARIGPGASRVGSQHVSWETARARTVAPDRRAGHKLAAPRTWHGVAGVRCEGAIRERSGVSGGIKDLGA